MLKEYELWLDESGSFENERENAKDKEKFPWGFHPSLIGGWLVPYRHYRQEEFSDYVIADPEGEQYHVAGIDKDEGKRLAFDSMRAISQKDNGKMVLFQNKELEDPGNRELYLRLMAAGLLQLIQGLNAAHESIKLHVIIARRMDMTRENQDERAINDDEYIHMLKRYILSKKRAGRVSLHEDTEMSISVDSGRKDNRLKMADYVCHTELTLYSGMYTEKEIGEYETLRKKGYSYSFTENTTENSINIALAQGNIADALKTAVINCNSDQLDKMLALIGSKISAMGYRGGKVHLDQCTREFTTYVYMEDDYERSESYLETLLDVVIPFFEERRLPVERFRFAMELLLADMYLREGDIEKAHKEMEKCRKAEAELPASLENLLAHYQLLEKESLLAIDSFDFKKGNEIMDGACKGFEQFLECVTLVEAVKDKFKNAISEYYGDALCMKIYAELFLQRFAPEISDRLVNESDIALEQYGPHEGELERHREYRSVIETQRGNYDAAVKWLLMTQKGRINMDSLTDGTKLIKEDYSSFLKSVIESESKVSGRYYLMYYVKIMAEAALSEDETIRAMADDMADVLYSRDNSGIHEKEDLKGVELHRTDHGTMTAERVVRDLDNVLRRSTYIDYHPLEVNYWKQATYRMVKKQYTAAVELYKKALKVCYAYSDYIQLAVIGLGIRAEYIVCLIDKGDAKAIVSEYKKLFQKADELMKSTSISSIRDFISTIQKAVTEANENGVLNREKMWSASRLITF
ncbi:MAG: hypothetical protein K6F00_02245 [Lachnospiraceae bacterium]|nr:hypothetical protein [Lachnospiraceae bacterium]